MQTFLRLVAATAVMLLFQIITYFGSEIFQKDPHNVLTKADSRIPFLPATALIYSLWFPLIAVFPVLLFYADIKVYGIYITAMVLDIIVSVIIYLIYPTSFVRPVPPDTAAGRIMKIIYTGSYRGLNCAPSLHCSSCMLIIICSIAAPGLGVLLRAVCIIVSAGIVISTMTTKQHALVDFLTAIPMAILSYAAGCLFPAALLADWILR